MVVQVMVDTLFWMPFRFIIDSDSFAISVGYLTLLLSSNFNASQ